MGVGIMRRRHRRRMSRQAARAVKRGRRKNHTGHKKRIGWMRGVRSKGYSTKKGG